MINTKSALIYKNQFQFVKQIKAIKNRPAVLAGLFYFSMKLVAAMGTAAVVAAGMAFAVVVAADIGIIIQIARQECFHSIVSVTGNAAIELDASLSQSHLCTAADATADQNINTAAKQEACQSAVTAAVGIHDLGGNNAAVFDIVDLKLLGMTKMLENQLVCVSNCNFHGEELLRISRKINYSFFFENVKKKSRKRISGILWC